MERDSETASTQPCCANCQFPCSAGIAASRAALVFARSPLPPPGSDSGMTLHRILSDDAVVKAMVLTAQMFGLPRETVATIVRDGLPAISRLAGNNRLLRSRLYAVSCEPLPEPIEQLYARMVKSPFVRQEIMDDYRATYGEMLNSVNRAVGRQAGTTDGQAREVLAALLPAICQVLGQANPSGELGFALRLLELGS